MVNVPSCLRSGAAWIDDNDAAWSHMKALSSVSDEKV